jgi:hypothetical protein
MILRENSLFYFGLLCITFDFKLPQILVVKTIISSKNSSKFPLPFSIYKISITQQLLTLVIPQKF